MGFVWKSNLFFTYFIYIDFINIKYFLKKKNDHYLKITPIIYQDEVGTNVFSAGVTQVLIFKHFFSLSANLIVEIYIKQLVLTQYEVAMDDAMVTSQFPIMQCILGNDGCPDRLTMIKMFYTNMGVILVPFFFCPFFDWSRAAGA